jgi:hypothetical protein
MWVFWAISALSAGLVATCIALLRKDWGSAPRSWKLLAGSAIPLAIGGLGFIIRFWEPSGGPFRANELYPLGPYLNAWAVSFGFMWLAFGLTFYAFALRAPHTGRTWFTLLIAWFLAWVPHGIIGIGFAAAGDNEASVRLYQDWASRWLGMAQLGASALILFGHFALSVLGFALTGKALLQRRRPGVSS